MKQKNQHDIIGKILHIGMPEMITDTYYKRTVVIDQENPRSSQPFEIPFEFFQQNMDLLNGFAMGDIVHIAFQCRGRKTMKNGKAKWWSTNEGIMIQKVRS